MQTRVSVLSSKPTTLEEAIQLTITTSDIHTKASTLPPKGTNKAKTSISGKKKRKAQNFTATNQTPMAQAPPAKRPYKGTLPKCATCQYHHPPHLACRLCNTCRKPGHIAANCHSTVGTPGYPQPIAQYQGAPARACYYCGDPNHMRPQCPQLIYANQGRSEQTFNTSFKKAT